MDCLYIIYHFIHDFIDFLKNWFLWITKTQEQDLWILQRAVYNYLFPTELTNEVYF